MASLMVAEYGGKQLGTSDGYELVRCQAPILPTTYYPLGSPSGAMPPLLLNLLRCTLLCSATARTRAVTRLVGPLHPPQATTALTLTLTPNPNPNP